MLDWVSSLRMHRDSLCLVGGKRNESVEYGEMTDRVATIISQLRSVGVSSGSVVAFPGQYSANSVAAMLAIADMKAIAVPLPEDGPLRISRLLEIANATHRIDQGTTGSDWEVTSLKPPECQVPWAYQNLQEAGHGGLVLFTSGSTGDPKAAVQDLARLRLRYRNARQVGKMLAFMHLDHIGGVNTLLFTLTHGGTLVVPKSRSPHDVAMAIQEHRIEVLPVSPTFLNLLLLSGALDSFDLTSLKRVTYGSEAMPQSLLDRLTEKMPQVDLLQTYGTTELGILQSKSENNGSLWMKVGGHGYETKVVDNRLWVKAETAMVGYLNAPSPFDEEGFMDTGDQVEVRGEWMRILGRKCDIINVGGIKIAPIDVESVLAEMPEVAEVSVVGRPHPMTGQVVEATVRLDQAVSVLEFKRRMREYCRGRLPQEAIPVKVILTDEPLVTDRFKREHRRGSVPQ